MSSNQSPLRDWAARADHIVGVIDLKTGLAVHAERGNRDHYQPVEFCGGDASVLATHYASLGITRLYIADLDAICDSNLSHDSITKTMAAFEKACGGRAIDILLDIGGSESLLKSNQSALIQMQQAWPSLRWIAATESLESTRSLNRFVETLGADFCVLSLDHRGGVFQSVQGDEETWLASAKANRIQGFVVLDLHAVGARSGACTAETCQRVRQRFPAAKIYSGGGVRNGGDIDVLRRSGCDFVLMATALHPV